jgi:hypothetical protein
MKATTTNILYLYNNIVECVESFKGNIDEHSWLCIETGFQPKVGEVFEVSIKQADFCDGNMWCLNNLIDCDYETGNYIVKVSKIAPVIDDWFRWNK